MLEVTGLEVAYGERQVISGIDLCVAAGEVVGLIGPNGCGKTTLLKAITGNLALSAGDVRFDGKSTARMTTRDLARRVAVVPQSPRLPAGFTARDVVLMGRTAHLGFFEQEGLQDYRRVAEVLAVVGAESLADRDVDEMSGGERQNVVIARALAQDAPVLLLDEPTTNLDIGHQMKVASLMKHLAGETQMAILAAIHDLTLAALYCDRLILMSDGLVLASGPPEEVLSREKIALAYGVDVLITQLEGLAAPIVLPLNAQATARSDL